MAIKTSATRKQAATNYKTNRTWERNRKRKLQRALKRDPNNTQIEQALQNIVYRRKTPKAPYWSKTMIQVAKVYKLFTGTFNRDIFSNNEKIALPALMTKGTLSEPLSPKELNQLPAQTGSMFSLNQRARFV